MKALIHYLRRILEDPFKRYVTVGLVALVAILLIVGSPIEQVEEPETPEADVALEVDFFYHSGCTHCRDQEPFNEDMAIKYPNVYFIYHDGADPGEYTVLVELIQGTNISESELDFPATIIGNRVFVGWESREVNGPPIEQAIIDYLAGNAETTAPTDEGLLDEQTIPILGTIHLSDYSLPGLAVVLGLVDGFNPCAMWVLAYLISVLFVLRDRRKAWLLVGSFVAASGILYYLFMTAWLNAFLLIGYSRPVTLIIGAVALGTGLVNIQEYIKSGGQIVCEVVDADSRKSTMSRIQTVVSSPLNIAGVLAIIGLAFVVNSIEFVCSAALPAIFVGVLTVAGLTTAQYYMYILLYVFFFMLDDLIIFGAAAFAMNTSLGERYAKYCKPVGGIILLILGALLLFAPQLLR